jgi:hypothetical protein
LTGTAAPCSKLRPSGSATTSLVAAEQRAREHALAVAEPLDALAQLEDGAGHLVADDARRLRRVRVEPHPRHHVGEVDARCGDVDPHLAGTELRVGPLLHLQHPRPAVLGDGDRPHARERIRSSRNRERDPARR